MPAYDAARFDPPAPLALVTVKSEQLHRDSRRAHVGRHRSGCVSAPSLTGVVTRIGRRAAIRAGSIRWNKSTAPAITAELQLLGKSFRDQFLLIDNWHGVLGRNILNNLSLLFDGPARKWTEQR